VAKLQASSEVWDGESTCGTRVFATLHSGEMTRSIGITSMTIDFRLGRTSASKAIVVFLVLLLHLVFMYALSCIGCCAETLATSSHSLGRLNLASLYSPSLRMPSNSLRPSRAVALPTIDF
jgi:hypothetical protein